MSDPSIASFKWPFHSLDELCTSITDGSHFSPVPQESGRCIANVKDMRDGCIDLKSCTKISERDFDNLCKNGCLPKYDDILLSKDGTIGRVVIYRQSEKIVVLSSIAILGASPRVNPRFLGQVLRSFVFSQQVESYKSGSALRRLVLRDIRKLRIPLPPLHEQRHIAEILDTIDEAIQKTEALISKLKAMKQGLLHDLLTRGLDKNGKLRDSKAHPEQFKDSPLGRIPKDWGNISLGELANFESGYAFKDHELTKYGTKVVRISNLHKSDFYYWRYSGPIKQSWTVLDGDLLFSWAGVASSIDVYLYRGEMALLNQHIYNLKVPDQITKNWLYHYLQYYLPTLRRSIEGGAGQLHLTKEKIQNIIVPVPPKDELREILRSLVIHDARIRTEEQYRDKLKLQKKGLMHDLLTGKVRVKV